jgi:hypothetical protein
MHDRVEPCQLFVLDLAGLQIPAYVVSGGDPAD